MSSLLEFQESCTEVQFSILSHIVASLISDGVPSFSVLHDAETCVVVQWISRSLTCIIDPRGDIHLIHSSIPEGPFSLHFNSKDVPKVTKIINSFLQDGPKLFHQCLYERTLSDAIKILEKLREVLSPLQSLLKVASEQMNKLRTSGFSPRNRIKALLRLLQNDSTSNSVPELETIIQKLLIIKPRPISQYLLPASDTSLDLIFSQRAPLKEKLSLTLIDISQLFSDSHQIFNFPDYNDFVSISEHLDQVSDSEFNEIYQKVEKLPISQCHSSVSECTQFVEKCTNDILDFDLSHSDDKIDRMGDAINGTSLCFNINCCEKTK